MVIGQSMAVAVVIGVEGIALGNGVTDVEFDGLGGGSIEFVVVADDGIMVVD